LRALLAPIAFHTSDRFPSYWNEHPDAWDMCIEKLRVIGVVRTAWLNDGADDHRVLRYCASW